ncbi:hypothetical protein ACTM96_14520, partial [Mediterraneibacter faecis]|uniref:hypothetical protein n=1 Tax=Mediterraneibacter faecis TaxID=592978 RepID=UPI003F8A1F90
RSFLLLNRQRLNRRKLPLSRLIIIEDLNLQKKFHTVEKGETWRLINHWMQQCPPKKKGFFDRLFGI